MKIFIKDDLPPEVNAMLQAQYSRSSESAEVRINEYDGNKEEASKFMKKFYVGYGHNSIADCGVTTIFIEEISMLAIKAIQQNRLYNGQESSTRYLDFNKFGCYDPIGVDYTQHIIRLWMDFYNNSMEIVKDYIDNTYKNCDDNRDCSDAVWRRTVNAKAFDLLRGFLPCGLKSQMSWVTSLRKVNERCEEFVNHPLDEVKRMGFSINKIVNEKYPESVPLHFRINSHPGSFKYEKENTFYYDKREYDNFSSGFEYSTKNFNREGITYDEIKVLRCKDRNHCEELGILDRLGTIQFKFLLDFGTYRDIQRHRGGIINMPLITGEYGYNTWYTENLPPELQEEVLPTLLRETSCLMGLIKARHPMKEEHQYFLPMMTMVPVELNYPLSQAVYVSELRSSQMVHPTLRPIAQQIGKSLQKIYPQIHLNVDYSESKFSTRRGAQTIIRR